MKFAVLGSGAVGGYYGAKLARAGHDVTFIARGAHLARFANAACRFAARCSATSSSSAAAEEDTRSVGPVDVVLFAVKAYDNATALPLVAPLVGAGTTILPLQNGVESAGELASLYGEGAVLAGVTYIATALTEPGLIDQTGTHRRIVFGEAFGELPRISPRVTALQQALAGADIQAEAVGDGRVPMWEKFIFLVSLAAFTGAARLPIGPLWAGPA